MLVTWKQYKCLNKCSVANKPITSVTDVLRGESIHEKASYLIFKNLTGNEKYMLFCKNNFILKNNEAQIGQNLRTVLISSREEELLPYFLMFRHCFV